MPKRYSQEFKDRAVWSAVNNLLRLDREWKL